MTTMLERPHDQESQAGVTPADAIRILEEGNRRFVERTPIERSPSDDVQATAGGQFPFAVVLGCIDSRVPIEMIFDQGIGDLFSARVAGNVVNGDVLGSMEFACKIAGSKAVVVLGHTACGAVGGAINEARMGNLTGLVQKIEPSVARVRDRMDPDADGFADAVVEENVRAMVEAIRSDSAVLAEMEKDGEIVVRGAVYDVSSGAVRFL